MFDEILEFFGRRMRQHAAEFSPSAAIRGRPFLDADDDQGESDTSRREDERHSPRRPTPSRAERDGDWF